MVWEDIRITRRGEEPFYITARNVPVPDKTLMISLVWDVTERKKAEDGLRLAIEHIRQIIDSNIVGVVIADAAGRIIETNDYYLGLIGYTRLEFEKHMVNWRAITPAEWLAVDEKALGELRERGKCTPYEKEYARRDGTRVPVYLANAMLSGPDNQIVAFVLDMSERKQAEDALRRSEKRLRETQEMARLGHWQWDVKTGKVEWSRGSVQDIRAGPGKIHAADRFDPRPVAVAGGSPARHGVDPPGHEDPRKRRL